MAISKERKEKIVSQYRGWATRSRALFLAEYRGLTVKDIDELRRKFREAGGEFHIVKNTLGKLAFEAEGFPLRESYFDGPTAIGFAFDDAPGFAKIVTDFARSNELLNIKGGYLDKAPISANDIQELAAMPPLPVMRARLLGMLMAPAGQLARTLSEPARQFASVLKAYADKGTATMAA